MINRAKKGKASNLRGRLLEEKVYLKIKDRFGSNGNYHHVYLERPSGYEGLPYHAKSKIEVDNILFYNHNLYIIQAKVRRGVSKVGRPNNFWLPNRKSGDLWFDGKKATGIFLDNLWKSERYLGENKLFLFHGRPKMTKVLVIDGILKVGDISSPIAMVRDTYVVTYLFFDKFLEMIQNNTLHSYL